MNAPFLLQMSRSHTLPRRLVRLVVREALTTDRCTEISQFAFHHLRLVRITLLGKLDGMAILRPCNMTIIVLPVYMSNRPRKCACSRFFKIFKTSDIYLEFEDGLSFFHSGSALYMHGSVVHNYTQRKSCGTMNTRLMIAFV